jgi:hypothetical protein
MKNLQIHYGEEYFLFDIKDNNGDLIFESKNIHDYYKNRNEAKLETIYKAFEILEGRLNT